MEPVKVKAKLDTMNSLNNNDNEDSISKIILLVAIKYIQDSQMLKHSFFQTKLLSVGSLDDRGIYKPTGILLVLFLGKCNNEIINCEILKLSYYIKMMV